jgi:dynein heavy chain
MKEDGQKSKQAKMNEEFEKTTHIIEDCKRLLLERRKTIENWKNKIDKGCIERIRTFQNPPALLGQILDMTVTLIGRKKFPELTSSSSAKIDRNANDSNADRADGSKTPKST